MIEITTYLGCALLVALILFQIALILGAPFGNYAWGGQHRVLPTKLRIGSASSIVIYLLFMAFLVSKSGVWNIITHEPTLTIGMWAMTGYLFFWGSAKCDFPEQARAHGHGAGCSCTGDLFFGRRISVGVEGFESRSAAPTTGLMWRDIATLLCSERDSGQAPCFLSALRRTPECFAKAKPIRRFNPGLATKKAGHRTDYFRGWDGL